MTSTVPNQVPATSEIKLNVIEDTSYVFQLTDFPFSDADTGQVLKFVKFTGPPGRGNIYLRGVAIQANQEISVTDIISGALTYTPMKNAFGEDYFNFMFAVSDGIEYSAPKSGGFYISPVEDAPKLHTSMGHRIDTFGNVQKYVIDSHQLGDGSIHLSTVKHGYEGGDYGYYTLHIDSLQNDNKAEWKSHIDLAYKFVNSNISSTLPLPDGKLLVTGTAYDSQTQESQFFVSRFDSDGELDKSFNQSGILSAQLAHKVFDAEVILQSDGKYLVYTKGAAGNSSQRLTLTLDRYNPDGSIDSGFIRFGVSASFNVKSEQEKIVSVQADGKILLLGQNYAGDAIVMMRLNPDGSLDQQFGTNASVNLDIEPYRSVPLSMAVQQDGKIVLLWSSYSDAGQVGINLARFNVDGSLDKNFDGDGKLSLLNQELGFLVGKVKNLIVSDDQKILITGSGHNSLDASEAYSDQIFVIRLENDGRLDKSFDADGVLALSLEESGENPLNVFLDSTGKITLTGTSYVSDKFTVIASYNNDGSIDHSFARPTLYSENASIGVRLDRNIWIDDPEMSSGTWRQSTLNVSRAGNANSEDLFYFPANFKFENTSYYAYGGKIYRAETAIASYANNDGVLNVSLDGNIIYGDILAVMRNVTYSNSKSGEQRLITLDWRFDEGVSGVTSIGTAQTEVMVASSSNSIPTASNIRGDLNPLSNHIFTIDEFQFRDKDAGDNFQGIVVLSLPEHKGLFLNNVEVRENQFISKADIENGLLRFRSLDLSQGMFKFSVSDGKSKSIPYDWTANVFETVIVAPEKFSISGSFTQGEVLTAVIKAGDVGDPNSVQYTWRIDGFANSQWNKATLTPNSFDVGKKVELTVQYQDLNGNLKIYRAFSDEPIKVGNDAPSGSPTLSGRSIVGETLSFAGGFYDGDGIESINGEKIFQFQWKADGVAIPGATSSNLLLDASLLGKLVAVDISYRDLKGKLEMVSGGKPSPVNEVTVFSSDDHTKIAKPGDNKFIGSSGVDTVVINQPLKNFLVMKGNDEYYLMKPNGGDELQVLRDIEHVQFQDFSMNLQVTSKARAMATTDVNKLIELYVAFFNRIPDADGLSYWMDQFNGGRSIEQIAQSFYDAGIQFFELTGFSKTMTNEDFIHVVYKNTLGRQSGADAEGLAYWSSQLQSGKANYGSLVSEILNSAHNFKGDTTWGWVADLLDNKIFAASKIAIDWGISFNTSEESITKGMEIVAAVTPTNSWDAIKLIGLGVDGIYL